MIIHTITKDKTKVNCWEPFSSMNKIQSLNFSAVIMLSHQHSTQFLSGSWLQAI